MPPRFEIEITLFTLQRIFVKNETAYDRTLIILLMPFESTAPSICYLLPIWYATSVGGRLQNRFDGPPNIMRE